jgi:hypothetical protein
MSDFCESERKRMNWLNSFQLPNQYKKIGWYFVLLVFILMIAKKFIDEPNWIKPVLKNAMILGFLIISLSKEKIEDELITKLRAQSYRLAFVFAVVYSLVQPYIEYGVDYLFNTNEVSMGFSYFQVLIFMLVVQIGFFEQFKRSA